MRLGDIDQEVWDSSSVFIIAKKQNVYSNTGHFLDKGFAYHLFALAVSKSCDRITA
jgi:hypothetical protein